MQKTFSKFFVVFILIFSFFNCELNAQNKIENYLMVDGPIVFDNENYF
jgi:hypothetical protein